MRDPIEPTPADPLIRVSDDYGVGYPEIPTNHGSIQVRASSSAEWGRIVLLNRQAVDANMHEEHRRGLRRGPYAGEYVVTVAELPMGHALLLIEQMQAMIDAG